MTAASEVGYGCHKSSPRSIAKIMPQNNSLTLATYAIFQVFHIPFTVVYVLSVVPPGE